MYGYNYPWSGRLGSIAKRCCYCGNDGPSFQYSSSARRCLKCDSKSTPILELMEEVDREYERLAKKWCDDRGIDYNKTIENYIKNLGPPLQENPIVKKGCFIVLKEKKLYVENVKEAFDKRVISSDLKLATEEEVNSYFNYNFGEKCKHNEKGQKQLVFDKKEWMYDQRFCAICGSFLGFI